MSLKNDAVVRTLSVLEFDFCFHLEYNVDVESFISNLRVFTINLISVNVDILQTFLAIGQNKQLIIKTSNVGLMAWQED